MGRALELEVSDGTAFAQGGDTAVVVYSTPARLHRIQWVFDHLEQLAAAAGPVNGLLIVLPSSDLPDAPTRAENTRRLAGLRGDLRQIVTVIIGDSMRTSLVRTVMRAMFLIQGLSRVQQIVGSTGEGIDLLLSNPTPRMPERAQLEAILREISKRLDCPIP